MHICGIVCEYNPFHSGHAYHIAQARRRGADAIVCVMSGNFVQRGEAALVDQYARAEMALRGGADLVLALPSPWAVASAERFASGAISLLCALGVVDQLAFGCEADSLHTLLRAAEIFSDPAFYPAVKQRMKTGESFAAARDFVLFERAPDCAEALRAPNNILAVEYLRALPASVKPIAIPRAGAAHDAPAAAGGFRSASSLRNAICSGQMAQMRAYLPAASFQILQREIDAGRAPITLAGHDRMLLSQLRRLSRAQLRDIPDVEEGLDARLFHAIAESATLDEILTRAKTKRYAHARLRRILLCAFLDITRDEQRGGPRYAQVLALNETGRTVLALARKKSRVPIITKPASAKKLDCAADFEREALRHALYALFSPRPAHAREVWRTTPFVLSDADPAPIVP